MGRGQNVSPLGLNLERNWRSRLQTKFKSHENITCYHVKKGAIQYRPYCMVHYSLHIQYIQTIVNYTVLPPFFTW